MVEVRCAPTMQGPRRSTVAGIAVVAIAVAAIAALVFLPTIVSAQETSWTITAREEDDCSETYCFDVSQSSFEAGTTVNATFENPSDNGQTHDALVELDGTWDESHDDTNGPGSSDGSGDDSDAGAEDIAPGNSSSFEFTVPSDRSDFYLWCDVTGHETLGMWENIEITGLDDGNGDGDGTNGDGTNGNGPSTPGFSAFAGIAAVGAALVLLKHRRD